MKKLTQLNNQILALDKELIYVKAWVRHHTSFLHRYFTFPTKWAALIITFYVGSRFLHNSSFRNIVDHIRRWVFFPLSVLKLTTRFNKAMSYAKR